MGLLDLLGYSLSLNSNLGPGPDQQDLPLRPESCTAVPQAKAEFTSTVTIEKVKDKNEIDIGWFLLMPHCSIPGKD